VKINLFHKVFLSIMLTTFIAFVAFFMITKLFLVPGYLVPIHRTEANFMDIFAEALAEEFVKHGSWELFRNKLGVPLPPLMPHLLCSEMAMEASPGHGINHTSPKESVVLPTISLLDAEKKPVTRIQPGDSETRVLREIVVGTETVGWLSLSRFTEPPSIRYFKQQARTLTLTGVGFLLFIALTAYAFTRHLLRPIREIAQGIRDIDLVKLGIQAPASSGDELAQLVCDFKSMAQTLSQDQKTRKQWTTDIAHELRTPLTNLQGLISAMQDGLRELSPQTTDILQTEVLRLTKLVEDLRELSIVDCGALYLKPQRLDPIAVLKVILQNFQIRFTQEQITVRDHLTTGQAQYIIMGDPDRLAQLYSNLLDNTLKYADKPGILVIRNEFKENCILLSFDDSGPGVPHEAIEHLFDRLYRLDNSRTRIKGGSGIGLAICKAIVEAHRGKITASNSQSGGLKIEIAFSLVLDPVS
jgi:two-component system, OmpR family, sensor histidine kinase BaeS